jgi:hypothetical protein
MPHKKAFVNNKIVFYIFLIFYFNNKFAFCYIYYVVDVLE